MSTLRSFIKSLPVLISLFYQPGLAVAQSGKDTTDVGKPETSIELVFTESNNHNKILTATVKTKVADAYEAVKGITVNFYQIESAPENLLGSSTSNNKGVAVFFVPEEKLVKKPTGYTFIAAVENDAKFDDNQEEIAVEESEFNMTLEEADSVRQVMVSLQAKDAAGNLTPVGDVEVHLYVQRLFGLLPLSADPETTDENGEVTAEFPAGIPGDSAGNLVIVARIEDNDRFGTVEFSRKINWGVPLIIDPHRNDRELWSSRANAPLYLIFIVNTMLFGIWGVILYIVFQVFKIKKLGRPGAA